MKRGQQVCDEGLHTGARKAPAKPLSPGDRGWVGEPVCQLCRGAHLYPAPAMCSAGGPFWLWQAAWHLFNCSWGSHAKTQPDITEWLRCCQIDLFLKWNLVFLSAESLSVLLRATQATPGENVASLHCVGWVSLWQLLSWSYQPLGSPPKLPFKVIFSLIFPCISLTVFLILCYKFALNFFAEIHFASYACQLIIQIPGHSLKERFPEHVVTHCAAAGTLCPFSLLSSPLLSCLSLVLNRQENATGAQGHTHLPPPSPHTCSKRK